MRNLSEKNFTSWHSAWNEAGRRDEVHSSGSKR